MKRFLILSMIALASPALAADPPLPTGPFEVVTQQIAKNLKVMRIQDGDNTCYGIIRQPAAAVGVVPSFPNLSGFQCLSSPGLPVEPEPAP